MCRMEPDLIRLPPYEKLDRAYDLIRAAIHQDKRLYNSGLDDALAKIVAGMERLRSPQSDANEKDSND